jgi:predicted 2-oxoglutarate/Fe(II)-dependent dioxygenase YbiX
MFFDLHFGQPMALFLCGRADAATTRAELAALESRDQDWKDVTRVAVVLGTVAECAALAQGSKPGFILLADDGALTAHLLGAPPTAMTAFVLDDNLRILERLTRAAEPAAFVAEIGARYTARPRAHPQVLRQQAPVLFIPRVFDTDLCQGLVAHFEETGGTPSGTAYIEGDKALWKPDPAVKMRRDVYLENGPWLERVRDALVRRALPEIKRCFNFQVTQHEVFKLIRYDEGAGYFRPHRDNESKDTAHRRFALTLNLNTGDYAGGQLRFPEFGPDLYEAGRGGAAVFSCSLLHEAVPVTRGKRYAVLGFFFSDAEQMAPMEHRDVSAGGR